MRFFTISKGSALPVVLLAVSAVHLVQTLPKYAIAQESVPVQTGKAPRSTSDKNSSDYAGAEACKTCHEDIYNGWEKGPHWKAVVKGNEGTPHRGCEGCHGAAASHVADPSDTSKLFLFTKASVKEINERCLTCHAGGPQHMNAINSIHSLNNISCISCHSPHHAEKKSSCWRKHSRNFVTPVIFSRNPNLKCPSIIASTKV